MNAIKIPWKKSYSEEVFTPASSFKKWNLTEEERKKSLRKCRGGGGEPRERKRRWQMKRKWRGRRNFPAEWKPLLKSEENYHTNQWEGEEHHNALNHDHDLGTMMTMIWQGDNGVKGNDGDTRWWFVTPPPDDIISKGESSSDKGVTTDLSLTCQSSQSWRCRSSLKALSGIFIDVGTTATVEGPQRWKIDEFLNLKMCRSTHRVEDVHCTPRPFPPIPVHVLMLSNDRYYLHES